jgi:hypothetical protein
MILSSVTKSQKEVPSKKVVQYHAIIRYDHIATIHAVDTGLTTVMEIYQLSESSRDNF